MLYDMQNFLDIQLYCKKEKDKSKQSNIARLDTVASDVCEGCPQPQHWLYKWRAINKRPCRERR